MRKLLISSLAVLAASFAYAAPSPRSVSAESDEVVAVPSDEQGAIVDNKKPNSERPHGCGCDKGKKGGGSGGGTK